MAERIVLDPTDVPGVTHARASLDITDWITSSGVDWGDAQMQAYMSEQAVGSAPVDFTIPNRQCSMPLNLRTIGGTAFDTIRTSVQAKVGIWQSQGGWLRRVTTGGTVFLDVVSAQLHLGGDYLQARGDADTNAAISFECLPDAYEAEETLSDHVETTLPEITFIETTTNGGDFPLGDRVRVVVDEDDADSQQGMFWAFRGKNYSAASTAASAFQAEALQALDTATKVAKTGASGGTVVTHGTLSTNWTPVVGTNIGGTSWLTHTGTYRIRARVFSTSGTAIQSRFVWDVGDLVLPVENDAVRLYDGGTFHILDLGEVRLDAPPTGPMRWQGQIQAKGDVGAESFSVDRVWIVNQDESSGFEYVPLTPANTSSAPVCRDEFNQVVSGGSDPLNGLTAAAGGAWTTVAGDADDFVVEDTTHTAQRTAVSDADVATGRYAVLGSSVAACVVQANVKFSSVPGGGLPPSSVRYGVLARYVDTSNWLTGVIGPLGPSSGQLYVVKRVAAASTILWSSDVSAYFAVPTYSYQLILNVDAAGRWAFYLGTTLLASGTYSVLATGGTLASGKVGLYDTHTVATACTRNYDSFISWSPVPDAVAFASQSCELGTQGIIREDSGGTAYGPVSAQLGDLPRMPNRSSAGTVEFTAKMSRGNLLDTPDPGIDDISARVYRRASHLLIPS